ncbi:unnamed protein product, partial [marine sediment metagenome]
MRGFADRFSDLDITVFLDRDDKELQRAIRSIALEEEKRSGLETDLMIHDLEDSRKKRWDEIERREFSKAKVVFDPEGQIEELLNEKLSVSRDFWVNRITTLTEYLKWYCCPSEEGVGTITEAWIERGDLVAAHHCVSYGLEVILEMLFALNREFFPSVKWRLFDSYGLKWLPNDYRHLVQEMMIVRSFSKGDLDRRLNAVRQLWDRVLPKVEQETRMTLEELDVYYVRNILRQNVSFFQTNESMDPMLSH